MRIGYARVSTEDQDLQLQRDALEGAGCEKIYEDTATGAHLDRPGLDQALEFLRAGDTLVVYKLDRLARSLKDLLELASRLEGKEVELVSVTDGIDTSTPAGRFFFHIMGALAQMERDLIVERTRAGLEAARKKGRVGGRPRKMTEGKIEAARKLLEGGMSYREVAEQLGVSTSRLYHYLPAAHR